MHKAIHKIINDHIEAHYGQCTKRAIYRMRRAPAGWDSDDSSLRSLWDHWKWEMQEDSSFHRDLIEDAVQMEVSAVVDELSSEDQELMMLAIDGFYDLDDDEPELPLHGCDDIVTALMERINECASNEPHRREVQRMLDNRASDRYDRDMEGYG